MKILIANPDIGRWNMANQVSRYQPRSSALSLRDAMDRLFEDSFVWPRWAFSSETVGSLLTTLPLDMYETPDEVVVHAVLPGVDSNNVDIQFQEGRLIIDSTIPAPKVENVTWYYRELPNGQYHRELTLPAMVQTDKVDATLQNGILTLKLPKAEEVKPKKIQIKATNK